MVARYTATVKTSAADNAVQFWQDYEDFAYETWVQTVDDNIPDMLDELQYQPGKVKYPIEWTSEKQRRAVMAKLREENNLPYQRTGKLAAAWVIDHERNGNQFLMVIENPSKVSKFVYGSLARNRNEALRFQQKFHANTGWQAATDTVQFWIDAVIDDYRTRMRGTALATFRGRAFTR